MPKNPHAPVKEIYRRIRLQLEELETRDVPSSTIADATIDPTQFAADHVLVRWQNDMPVDTALDTGWESLGNNTYSVSLESGITVSQAIDYYTRLTGVDFAQPDYVLKTTRTANDPFASQQWALNNINAQTAWNYSTGSSSIIVAVIDTGVDYRHTDLAQNIWTNTREIAGNGRDDDANGFVDDVRGYDFANNDADPMDDNGHGTHVAGIIGAVGNNGVGATGTNWNVKIMPVKFMSASGSGYLSNAVKSVNYAVQMGAKIVNNSWGGGGYDQAMASAITNAQNQGVIFVVAAGNAANNNDANPQYPANYSNANVVSVAASDRNNNLSSFSNYGAGTVDIAAPGSSIISTTPNNTYSSYSGTSMASPYVAGAMALVWSIRPDWTYSQVIADVLNTANRSTGVNGKVTTGLLDLGKAAATAAASTPVTPAPYATEAMFNGTSSSFTHARVVFSSPINASTFTADDVVVTGPSGQRIPVTRITPMAGTNNTRFDVAFASQTQVGTYTMTIGPDVRDMSGRQMDQNRNGTAGQSTDKFTLTGSIGGVTSFSSGNVNQTIADLSTTTSTINIGQNVNIGSIRVNVNLTHTYDSDLTIKLVSPTGKEVTLFNRRGGSADNLTNTTFDDSAATAISAGKAPFTGSFKPESSLSAFANTNAAGAWKLVITDTARYDSGRLANWSITINTTTNVNKKSDGEGEGESAAAADSVISEKGGEQAPERQQEQQRGEVRLGQLPTWVYQHSTPASNVIQQTRNAVRSQAVSAETGSTFNPIVHGTAGSTLESDAESIEESVEEYFANVFIRL